MRSILFSLFLCFSLSLTAQNVSFTSTGVSQSSACLGQQTTFQGEYPYPDSVSQWKWDFDNDGQYDDASVFGKTTGYAFTYADTFFVSLKVVLINGAVDSMSQPDTVIVNPLPQANFTVENMCEGQTAVFFSNSTISSGSIDQYFWDFKNDGSDNDTGALVTFNCGPAETYQSKLRCISDKGCESFALKTTQVFNQPVANFSVQSSCLGGNTGFINNSTIATGNIDYYLWDFGDGDSSVLAAPVHIYTAEQKFNVKLTAISDQACKATFSDSITIVQLINTDFSIQNTCLGGTTQFINNTTTQGGEVVNSFSWDYGDASTGITSGNASHQYGSANTYTVALTAVSQNGCTDNKTASFTLSQLINAAFTSQNGCIGLPTTFTHTSTLLQGEVISALYWNFGDGTATTSSGNTSHNFDSTGTYNVILIAESQNFCRDTVNASVTVYKLPEVELVVSGDTINDSTIYKGHEVTLTVDGSVSSYLWNTGVTAGSIIVSDTGTFSVTATNSNGCSQVLTKKINTREISDTVVAGNDIITPNGDGINDKFVIMDVSGYKQCAINIFNIWNEEVYSTSGYKNDWDGKNKNGKDLDAGAYYYILKCDEKAQTIGTVNILR